MGSLTRKNLPENQCDLQNPNQKNNKIMCLGKCYI